MHFTLSTHICTVRTKRIGLDWIDFWSTKPDWTGSGSPVTDLDWTGFFQTNPFHTLIVTQDTWAKQSENLEQSESWEIIYMKQTKVLTHVTHVNSWFPDVYLLELVSYMGQIFRLFHLWNFSVLSFRFFSAHIPASCVTKRPSVTIWCSLAGRPSTELCCTCCDDRVIWGSPSRMCSWCSPERQDMWKVPSRLSHCSVLWWRFNKMLSL